MILLYNIDLYLNHKQIKIERESVLEITYRAFLCYFNRIESKWNHCNYHRLIKLRLIKLLSIFIISIDSRMYYKQNLNSSNEAINMARANAKVSPEAAAAEIYKKEKRRARN